MKIVQINAVYGTLSTGKIVRDIHEALKDSGNDSYVFWGTLCRQDKSDKNIMRVGNTLDHKLHALLYRADKKQGWHSAAATRRLCRRIKEIGPDVVHLHNLHSNYINLPILLRYLAENSTPTLLTIHDCWFFTGYCTYYTAFGCDKWQSGCKNCPACISDDGLPCELLKEKEQLYKAIPTLAFNGVSRWTAEAAEQSILSPSAIKRYIYNWIDLDIFRDTENRAEVFKKYGIPPDKKLILGVSQSWSVRKGLNEFIELSNRFKEEAQVVLVGESSAVPHDSGIKTVGFTNSASELAELYSAADVFVNPSRMETFGLVTAEAMACGTPVASYANTGSLELVTEECGRLAKDGDIGDMISAVEETLKNGRKSYSESCRGRAVRLFKKEERINDYIRLYSDIINYGKKEKGI